MKKKAARTQRERKQVRRVGSATRLTLGCGCGWVEICRPIEPGA